LYKLCVKTFALQETFMLPVLDDLAILHDKNSIGVSDCGKTMRNDDGRSIR
jgi:hypothetical protein